MARVQTTWWLEVAVENQSYLFFPPRHLSVFYSLCDKALGTGNVWTVLMDGSLPVKLNLKAFRGSHLS